MRKFHLPAAFLAVGLLCGASTVVATVPSLVSYQGVLTDTLGQPLDGTYSMMFAIYDGPDTEASVLWLEIQGVEVSNGSFDVLLGASNQLTDDIFSDTGRYLGITIGSGEPEIWPRTPLVSAPYALRIQTVDGATGGNIYGDLQLHSTLTVGNTSGKAGRLEITNGAATVLVADGASGKVGIGVVAPDEKLEVDGIAQMNGFKMPTGAAEGHVLTSDATGVGTWQPASGGGTGWNWSDSSSHGPDSVLYADTSDYAVHVQTIHGSTGGNVTGNISLYDDGDLRASLIGQGYGELTLRDFPDGDLTVDLSAGMANGGKLHLYQEDGSTLGAKLMAGSASSGAIMEINNTVGDATIILDAEDEPGVDNGARMTLLDGTAEAITLDAIDANTSGAVLTMTVYNDTTVSIYANGDGGDGGGIIRLYDGSDHKTVHIDANGAGYGGAQVSLSDHDGTTTISMDAESGGLDGGANLSLGMGNGTKTVEFQTTESGTDGAQVFLYDANSTTTVDMDAEEGTDGGAILRMYEGDGTKTIHIDAQGVTYGGAQVSLSDHDGTTTISLDAESGALNGGANVVLQTGAGAQTIRLDADYDGSGEGRVITTVLEITGGADLSEQFDVRNPVTKDNPSPGMVVCIDSEHPGDLVVSSKAYDPGVAGIISGAGGIKPGMLMAQIGNISDGEYPVALTGRVYCLADASYGSIKPGDLLTTSDTPGHAMRVDDFARSQGAILGKAMTALDSGTGLVLALVSLQ